MNLFPDFLAREQDKDRPWSTSEVMQRHDFALAALHGSECAPCQRFRKEASGAVEDFGTRDAVLLMLQPSESPVPPGPRVLLDPNRKLSARVLGAADRGPPDAALLTCNRFGRIESVQDIHAAAPDALIAESLETIDFIQEQCPECGVPTW